MCGRYAILEEETILEMREIINQVNKNYVGRPGLVQCGDVAPTQVAPVLRDECGLVKLDVMKWGFPRWDNTAGVIINARIETVCEKKTFREAFQSRRIVVPSSGFYEWDHRQTSKRDKYFFSLSGQVVYMAGIYSSFASLDGSLTECFVILTCPAADSIAELHDRMPVILPKSAIRTWLSPQTDSGLLLSWPAPPLAGTRITPQSLI